MLLRAQVVGSTVSAARVGRMGAMEVAKIAVTVTKTHKVVRVTVADGRRVVRTRAGRGCVAAKQQARIAMMQVLSRSAEEYTKDRRRRHDTDTAMFRCARHHARTARAAWWTMARTQRVALRRSLRQRLRLVLWKAGAAASGVGVRCPGRLAGTHSGRCEPIRPPPPATVRTTLRMELMDQ
eukprot:Rmarinus@m.3986